jgi:uncharacterized protein
VSAVSDLVQLLRTLEPVLNPGVFAFCSVPFDADLRDLQPLATFREQEGLTLIVPEEGAAAAGLQVLFRSAWITLKVHSDLQAVGLTAAFSRALGEAGISCNVVAAAFHDHIFVPVDRAAEAVARLRALQAEAAARA